jgi:hypothetical protein
LAELTVGMFAGPMTPPLPLGMSYP